jgi:hypothetical protein
MSKLVRVIFEYDDKIMDCRGEEAQKLYDHIGNLCAMAQNRIGNQNPFAYDPINWHTISGGTASQRKSYLEHGTGPMPGDLVYTFGPPPKTT